MARREGRPWIGRDTGPFEPGRALVMQAPLTCICGGVDAHLSQSGHTIRCFGCGATEIVVHTGAGEDADVHAAGYAYALAEAPR